MALMGQEWFEEINLRFWTLHPKFSTFRGLVVQVPQKVKPILVAKIGTYSILADRSIPTEVITFKC